METRHLNPGWSHIRNRKNKKKIRRRLGFQTKKRDARLRASPLYNKWETKRSSQIRNRKKKSDDVLTPAGHLAPPATSGPCARPRTSRRLRPLRKKKDEEAADDHRKKDEGGGSYLVPDHWWRRQLHRSSCRGGWEGRERPDLRW
jgi:hypothetical protein